jgi:hypothetical protein
MKTTAKTLMIAISLMGLGTGCDFSDLVDLLEDIGTGVGNPGDQTDPDDGDDQVEPPIAEDPTMPPEDICQVDFDRCVQAGEDPQACEQALVDCWNGGWTDPCYDGYVVCTSDPNADFQACENELNTCYGWEPNPCDLEFEACLSDANSDPAACEEALYTCYGWEPDPCGPAYEECYASGRNSFECESEYQECWGIPADPCWDEYAICASDPNSDLAACDEQLYVCWSGGVVPEPIGVCQQMFDLCLIGGVDPAVCELALSQCTEPQPEPPCDLPVPNPDGTLPDGSQPNGGQNGAPGQN